MQNTLEHDALEAGRLVLMLGELRLPTIGRIWPTLAETADRDGWPAARFLSVLIKQELADRSQRRMERYLADAGLAPGKTFACFDFNRQPLIDREKVMRFTREDEWIEQKQHILCCGPAASGKSHFAAAIGHSLVENGFRVLFTDAAKLARQLLGSRELGTLVDSVARLNKYQLIIIDDVDGVANSRDEEASLCDFVVNRYMHGSLLMTGRQPFQTWLSGVANMNRAPKILERLVAQSSIFLLVPATSGVVSTDMQEAGILDDYRQLG